MPIPAYTQYTLADIRGRLAQRLNDPSNVHWTSNELNFYLQESLDTWNLYARYLSSRATITLTAGQHELDLSNVSGGQISHLVSGQKILTSSLLHLLELTDPTLLGSYVATGHISTTLLNNYISTAFNQFIQESYCYLNKREYPLTSLVLSATDGLYTLDPKVSNIAYAEHITLESNVRNLRRVDMQSARNLMREFWNSRSRPEYYSLETSNALQLYLLPWPNDISTLRLYTVESTKLTANLVSADQSFSMPYEFWWGVKFLALYKIYSTDGPTSYPQLAQYCLQRYKESISLARDYTPINFAWAEEQPIYISPFKEFDNIYPGWRNKTSIDLDSGGKLRKELGILSPNIVISPSKYSRDVSFSFDLIRNAPTLASGDNFPVGEEFITYILDYAEHLAAIKLGGKEFADTLPLYESFVLGAMRYNDKLKASLPKIKHESQGAYANSQSSQESDRREAKVGVKE